MSYQQITSAARRFRPAAPVALEDARETLVDVCGSFELSAFGGADSITGAIEGVRLGQFNAAVVATHVRSVWRDAAMIRRDPGRNLFLIYQETGCSVIRQGDSEHLMQPGSFHLVDSAFPSEFRYFDAVTRKISVHLPREEALRRLGQTCVGGLAIDSADPLNAALEAVLLKLLTAAPDAAMKLSDTLVELLGAYLRCLETQTPSLMTEKGALLQKAKSLIVWRARDPSYGLTELCEDLGMSRRSVQRLFTANGETVSTALQDARLEIAHRELSLAPERTITDIAFASGFNDLSHFHRCFRTRYGMAPGAMRKRESPVA